MKLNTLNEDIKNIIKDYTIFKPKNKYELQEAVNLWCENKDEALNYYVHISVWDTSLINDMRKLFYDKKDFNQDISQWDVSNVTDMSLMFAGASHFNQSLKSWNISNVTYMEHIFDDAVSFDKKNAPWYDFN